LYKLNSKNVVLPSYFKSFISKYTNVPFGHFTATATHGVVVMSCLSSCNRQSRKIDAVVSSRS